MTFPMQQRVRLIDRILWGMARAIGSVRVDFFFCFRCESTSS